MAGRSVTAGGNVPHISVVMPVHSAMPYLPAAIESILAQDFPDFEFVIGDDASTDGSWECILALAARDPRIRPLRSANRLGPVASSNWVAHAARAPLIARMDADDVCEPQRLRVQWERLQLEPAVVAVGSLFEMIDAAGQVIRPVNLSSILRVSSSPCAHDSLMVRRSAFEAAGGYREGTDYFEDFDLYWRLAEVGRLEVFSGSLVRVRASESHSRLRDDRNRVVPQLARRMGAAAPVNGMDLGALRILAGLSLWSNRREGFLPDLIRRVRLSVVWKNRGQALFVLAAALAPAVVRTAIRLRLHWRNWRLRERLPAGRFFPWPPTRDASA